MAYCVMDMEVINLQRAKFNDTLKVKVKKLFLPKFN